MRIEIDKPAGKVWTSRKMTWKGTAQQFMADYGSLHDQQQQIGSGEEYLPGIKEVAVFNIEQ